MSQEIDTGRRGFWGDLAREFLMFRNELGRTEYQSLTNFGETPDEVLAEMVPTWMEEKAIEVREDGIYCASAQDGPARVHVLGLHEKIMVDQYAGGRNVKTIADYLARATNMDPSEAFQLARNLFVQLCERGLCHPAAVHGWQ